MSWWTEPFRTFQSNLREIDAGLDEKKLVDHILDLGANTWLLNTAGIVSFYPSELSFQHPSPWLSERDSGDLIADAVAEAHRRGVRVLSRVDFSKVHRDIAEAHPDWCFVSADGERQIYNGLYSTCPSAPYYQERSLDILGEVLDRYPVDGFFFNWFGFNIYDYSHRYYGICQCESCRRRFRKRYGEALPTKEDWDDPRYLQWRRYTRETLDELAGRIRSFIGARRPDVPLILGSNSDIVFHEANNSVGAHPAWTYGVGEAVRRAHTTWPEKPVWVNSVLFLDLPYRFVVDQPGRLGLYFAQTLAHGANPSAYIVGTPDLFPSSDFDIVRDVLRFHRDHQEHYAGLISDARVLVLSSPLSEELRGGGDDVVAERRGVHRALVEEHIPFDLLPAESLAAAEDRLASYDVIVLPNVACLDDDQCKILDAYVESGGGLVATHDASGFDSEGAQRAELGLSSLGARQIIDRNEHMRSAYLKDADGSMVLLDRAFLVVEPRADADTALPLVPPSRYGPPEKCYWDIETTHPGLLSCQHGAGCTAYLPWPVGSLFDDLRRPEHRRIIASAVRRVAGRAPLVQTDAPPQVEVVVGRQPGNDRRLVHLVNFSGVDDRAFHEPLEIRDIRLSVLGNFTAAKALRIGEELPCTADGDRTSVVLPRLGLFELLVLEA